MEILEIESHAELKQAKNGLVYAVVCGIAICMFSPILVQSDTLFNVVSLAFLIYSLYVLYRFSRIVNARLFRNYIYMIGIQILCSFVLALFESDSAFMLLQALVVYFIVALCCNMYFSYKIAYEMSAITDLRHFITAFKLYALASFVMLLGIFLVALAFDTSGIQSGMQVDVALSALAQANSGLLFAFLVLLVVIFATFCIALGFILRGLIKITHVKVRIPH